MSQRLLNGPRFLSHAGQHVSPGGDQMASRARCQQKFGWEGECVDRQRDDVAQAHQKQALLQVNRSVILASCYSRCVDAEGVSHPELASGIKQPSYAKATDGTPPSLRERRMVGRGEESLNLQSLDASRWDEFIGTLETWNRALVEVRDVIEGQPR